MKNKVLIIVSCLVLISLILFFSFKKIVKKENATFNNVNEDFGTTIVETGYLNKDNLESGTKISLAVPAKEEIRTDSDRELEKKSILEEKINEKNYDDEYQEKEYIPEVAEQVKKSKEIEERVLNILNKNYGSEAINSLSEKIKNETKSDDFKVYSFPESGKELLNKMLDLIDNQKVSEEEKNDLIYVINIMDLSTLNDLELKMRIEKLTK